MNETIRKFGYPATLVKDFDHWVVLLRPDQPTLGSLILAARSEVTAFGDLPPAAHAELATVTKNIETALSAAVAFERINYLMLMMVDPHVHFHVIPRYNGERSAEGVTLVDAGWPKLPELGKATSLDETQAAALVGWLKGHWSA